MNLNHVGLSGLVSVSLLLLVLGLLSVGCASPNSEPEVESISENGERELVVLVHGLGRTELSMLPFSWALKRNGYEVLNWGYSSTCCSVDELGAKLAADLEVLADSDPAKIHYIGHSLGNILIRSALDKAPPEQSGRIVMLAPPNDGAAVADRYVGWAGWLLEPLADLTTGEESTTSKLPAIQDREVGVIAGQFDGKVSVEETHHDGEKAHEVVPAAHTFIMNRPDVHRLIVAFLESGEF